MQLADDDLQAALGSYSESRTLRERLVGTDPGNAGWQRDLSVTLEKIGDVLAARGELPAAIAAYEESEPIARALAERFPEHRQFQSDYQITRQRLAELRARQQQG